MLVTSNWIISPRFGVNINKCLKPPPSLYTVFLLGILTSLPRKPKRKKKTLTKQISGLHMYQKKGGQPRPAGQKLAKILGSKCWRKKKNGDQRNFLDHFKAKPPSPHQKKNYPKKYKKHIKFKIHIIFSTQPPTHRNPPETEIIIPPHPAIRNPWPFKLLSKAGLPGINSQSPESPQVPGEKKSEEKWWWKMWVDHHHPQGSGLKFKKIIETTT